ncbi:hypothetical protein QTO34_017922, partial [Cnephaeus nilssonii]
MAAKLLAKKIIYSYLNLLVNSKNDLALAHILNIPDRGLGREAFTDLKHAAREKQMSIFLVATSFIRTVELGGKGYAPSPSDPLRTHVKGLSNFINFIDKLDEILGEIANPRCTRNPLHEVSCNRLSPGCRHQFSASSSFPLTTHRSERLLPARSATPRGTPIREALRSAGGQRKTGAGGKLLPAATQSATPSSEFRHLCLLPAPWVLPQHRPFKTAGEAGVGDSRVPDPRSYRQPIGHPESRPPSLQPAQSIAGSRILSVIKMQVTKGQNNRDPFCKAVEEVAQDLDLRIKNIISSQEGDLAVAPLTSVLHGLIQHIQLPKFYAINHGTAYCGRDTVKLLLVLLDEEAASVPTKNKAELLYDDEYTVDHNGTSILTLFRSPIQVNNSLVKPLRERIHKSMEEKKMKGEGTLTPSPGLSPGQVFATPPSPASLLLSCFHSLPGIPGPARVAEDHVARALLLPPQSRSASAQKASDRPPLHPGPARLGRGLSPGRAPRCSHSSKLQCACLCLRSIALPRRRERLALPQLCSPVGCAQNMAGISRGGMVEQ